MDFFICEFQIKLQQLETLNKENLKPNFYSLAAK